jgi:hypothetical protein
MEDIYDLVKNMEMESIDIKDKTYIIMVNGIMIENKEKVYIFLIKIFIMANGKIIVKMEKES